jgi:gamma-glutamylcyclotransferase (GGCT)/AIG2-like uncharacterized protein YtfP
MLEPVSVLPLFAYGTLTDAVFTGHLLERRLDAEPASLVDFERLSLVGFDYPVVVEAPGKTVEGFLYRHLSADDYARLDAYEGVGEGLYRRIVARVVAAGGERSPASEGAFVYVPGERTLKRYGSPRPG